METSFLCKYDKSTPPSAKTRLAAFLLGGTPFLRGRDYNPCARQRQGVAAAVWAANVQGVLQGLCPADLQVLWETETDRPIPEPSW